MITEDKDLDWQQQNLKKDYFHRRFALSRLFVGEKNWQWGNARRQSSVACRMGEGRRRRRMRKGLTANDTVFIVHGRTTLNPRIFLVSRTCSRERRGAASGTLEVGNITECAQAYPKRLGYSEVHFAFQRWSDPPDSHQRLGNAETRPVTFFRLSILFPLFVSLPRISLFFASVSAGRYPATALLSVVPSFRLWFFSRSFSSPLSTCCVCCPRFLFPAFCIFSRPAPLCNVLSRRSSLRCRCSLVLASPRETREKLANFAKGSKNESNEESKRFLT